MRKLMYSFIIVMTVFACSEEEITILEDPVAVQETDSHSMENGRANGQNCYVRPLHTSSAQSEGCRLYSTYAAVGVNQTNYDRRVTITVSEGGNQLQQVNVIIDAGSSTSNSAAILRNATEDYGSVTLKVTRVRNLSTGAIDYDVDMEERSFNPDNCFTQQNSGGGAIECPVPCEIGLPGGGYLGFD